MPEYICTQEPPLLDLHRMFGLMRPSSYYNNNRAKANNLRKCLTVAQVKANFDTQPRTTWIHRKLEGLLPYSARRGVRVFASIQRTILQRCLPSYKNMPPQMKVIGDDHALVFPMNTLDDDGEYQWTWVIVNSNGLVSMWAPAPLGVAVYTDESTLLIHYSHMKREMK